VAAPSGRKPRRTCDGGYRRGYGERRDASLGIAAEYRYFVSADRGTDRRARCFYQDVLNVAQERAGKLVSLYWLGAMVGRFAGSALLARFRAVRLLSVNAFVAAVLCLAVSQGAGVFAAGAALAIGLFNSIMLPNIFTLTLERSTASPAATSGLLCMAIVGGAVLPPLTGLIEDWIPGSAGLHAAFLLPMVAYALICGFAVMAARARVAPVGETAAGAAS
jgi:MFS transporter, FHS family, L-fucose permease